MNDSEFLGRMATEEEALHKEYQLLAEKSQSCKPEFLAEYAIAMCELYKLLKP